MPTIAELEVRIDSQPIKTGTESLNEFATAAERAQKATTGFNNSTTTSGGLAPTTETTKVKNLSEAIDQQTRKLNTLAQQRKQLESSDMKSTMPAEYERLNRIIDANIAKVGMQGDAVQQLTRIQDAQTEKAVRKANAEVKAQEVLTKATIAQENILTNASARQQRMTEQTLNGLSRQIKAQNDYNKAIDQFNRDRVIGTTTQGMMGPSLGGEEYDSYVKLAQAKRDASLATEDNSASMVRAQNKLDTYTATLGKVERAEVEFSRAQRTLKENLDLGNITMDQYNKKLQEFTDHRDKTIESTYSNAAAEEQLERQLNKVVGAYDPVLRAQRNYENSAAILKDGLDAGLISQDQYNKALAEQAEALDKVKSKGSVFSTVADDYEKALNAAQPLRNELKELEEQQRRLDAAKKAGLVVGDDAIKQHAQAERAIASQTEAVKKRIKAGNESTLSYKQEMAAMRGMPAQLTDIVVSLQGGQAPLTVLLQQGGQIKDMFGGVGAALKATGAFLLGLVNPLTVIGSVLGVLAVAAYQGSSELTEFNRALIQSKNASGASASDFTQFQTTLDGISGTSGKAAEALTQMAASGKIASDVMVEVGEAAIKTEKATGAAMDTIIADFTSLGKDPVQAAIRLDEKYKFLTTSVLAQADALIEMGKEQEAVQLLQSEMAKAASDTADKMIEEAGYIEQAWAGVKSIISETWDALKGIGREDTTQSRIDALKELQQNIIDYKGADAAERDKRFQEAASEIRILEQRKTAEKSVADQRKQDELDRVAGNAAMDKLLKREKSNLEGVAKAQREYDDRLLEHEKIRKAGNVSAETELKMTADLAAAQKKLDEAKEKANKPKRPGALDTTTIQEVKSNLTPVNAEYDGYYKRVTALGEANLVSQEATFYSQKAILEAQKKAVSSSYDDQISAINKLQENKKNSVAQNISLDNQLTKAEAAKAKALEDIDTRLDVLQSKENGRIQERTRNIAAYKAALDAQLESLRDEGARNAEGVGRGSRQAALNQRLGDNDRDFNKKQLALANALAANEIDPVEHEQKLKDLTQAHNDMTKQIIQNDRDIQAAEYEWTNGFTAAIENAQDDALNFAASTQVALEGAFASAGDALYQFVTTGKLSFSDFASSVIKDMARIASQQAANGLLSALLGAGMAAFGAGVTPTTTGVSGAGSFGQIGGSYTGTGVFGTFAKGGAFDGGVRRYAKGGTFTNSVVSSPTRFQESEMGEAGPEAIMPLQRTSDGRLGVSLIGGQGALGGDSNMTVVNVNVAVSDGKASSSTDGGSGYENFGQSLGTFVVQEIYKVINTETRPGGTIQPQTAS